MGIEIEKKFLVTSEAWRGNAVAVRRMVQGYLSRDPDRTVRVRIIGDVAFMTVKGRPTGITRTEIEFPLSLSDAEAMLALCHQPYIDKTRHEVLHEGYLWEVDEFHGQNSGLIVAEIELPSETTLFAIPDWAGREVSSERRYSNSNLSARPYEQWSAEERSGQAE